MITVDSDGPMERGGYSEVRVGTLDGRSEKMAIKEIRIKGTPEDRRRVMLVSRAQPFPQAALSDVLHILDPDRVSNGS